MKFKTYNLDCRDVIDMFLPDNSVDSIVTDPPYGLTSKTGDGGFMGKAWDNGVPGVEFWERAYRVLKPGGYLLAFGGPRTYHRLTCAIEDAGFEIRDSIMWMFGSGFPKSLDVSKAIDKAAGAERAVIRTLPAGSGPLKTGHVNKSGGGLSIGTERSPEIKITAPSSELAKQWDGWGTALKPAYEPVVVARKPLIGTVVQNVLMHGVGGLNIDGCRVTTNDSLNGGAYSNGSKELADATSYATGVNAGEFVQPEGRWPASLIHDGSAEVVALFPDSNSSRANGNPNNPKRGANHTATSYGQGDDTPTHDYRDTGSAARFFKSFTESEDIWAELEQEQKYANTAKKSLLQQKQLVVSVLGLVVNSVLPEGLRCMSVLSEHFTNATPSELRLIATSVTQLIQSLGQKFWLEQPPVKRTLYLNPVSLAAQWTQTDTMTITANHWRSDGSADLVTFNITPPNLEHGGNVLDGSRFIYVPKANKKDRNEGCDGLPLKPGGSNNKSYVADVENGLDRNRPTANNHPTIKPTDLMAYLCRLVTPPGGTVLDPFMGSGSTGKAALREGFRFIGCELEAEYHAIAEARLKAAAL